MASSVSYEFLKSQYGVAGGLATLDNNGLVPTSQLPPNTLSIFQGQFADEAALVAAVPTGQMAWFAYNLDTSSFWYWSIADNNWQNQQISEASYILLSSYQQSVVPFIVVSSA